ncbi:mediator of RNA polymerase II transcription subunit 20 isoform X1 [Daphnia magna]|uniref:Mediator of RNA polymerase II transcription subunit 20 n=2 Tax=Daphnia magna TaxID=35525 RepID=A0A0P5LWA6_9CRUS|nr:mediator of RNA polymerase II transcription subunit 20 isoform X1 [Daphnia magna]KZS19804.1 Mediator of RNA polymerase II transcription subunit 20 [Daphnia magna]
MGVIVLQLFAVPEGKSGPQVIDILTKRVTSLGGVLSGSFMVDCETYTSVASLGATRSVHLLHNSETPASVFALLEAASGNKTVALVADNLFDLLMLKLSNFYQAKKQTKIESRGPRFEAGDFLVKLGSVTMGPAFKGILVEVEYQACSLPAACWDLIREFMQGFLGGCVPSTPPQYIQNRFGDMLGPIDGINQYLEQFNAFRKTTGIR